MSMVADTFGQQAETGIGVLVGRWEMTASFDTGGAPPPVAETTFEWLAGGRFLVQRWHVDHPDAPDGIAVIGRDADSGTCRQHYFDSRGVARVYEMSLRGGVWRLQRVAPGFCQRFKGVFNEAGDVITGAWEASIDGVVWQHDFDLTYRRVDA